MLSSNSSWLMRTSLRRGFRSRELPGQVVERSAQRACGRVPEQGAVKEPGGTGTWFERDDQPVVEPFSGELEVPLVRCIGHAVLDGVVAHKRRAFQLVESHVQLGEAASKAHAQPHRVAGLLPPCLAEVRDVDEVWPEMGPVRGSVMYSNPASRSTGNVLDASMSTTVGY